MVKDDNVEKTTFIEEEKNEEINYQLSFDRGTEWKYVSLRLW